MKALRLQVHQRKYLISKVIEVEGVIVVHRVRLVIYNHFCRGVGYAGEANGVGSR